MTAAILICAGIGCLFGLGLLVGAGIHFGNPTTEEPLTPEQEAEAMQHFNFWC